MKRTIIVVVCCVIAVIAGLTTFDAAKEGFMQMGINAVSADKFSRIIWSISTAVSLTALMALNMFIERD